MGGHTRNRVVVIGAGIAGLATAYYLRKQGAEVTILERDTTAGGAVRSIMREDKYLLELGPNAFLASADPITKLARELSIDSLIVGSEERSRNRYIYKKGKMHSLPMGPLAFLKSGLLSFSGKMRLFAEPLVRSKSVPSETLASFVTRRGGKDILNSLVDPFVSGVWAGDASELEVESVLPKLVEIERECGSVIKGMKKFSGGSTRRGLFSFRWGMGTLTARLEEELKNRMRLGLAAESVERKADETWKIKFSGWHSAIEADAIVIAAPAHAAAKLILPLDAKMFSYLSAISYASLAVVHTVFREKDISQKLDGFGVLIPRGENIRMLGSIWSSALFPGRCPKGEVLLTNFVGGASDPGLIDLSDEEIIGEVEKGLGKAMGISTKPTFTYLKRWSQAIPQYTVGHKDRLSAIRARLDGLLGLFLVGSYFAGVSVSDTIAHARGEVDRIAEYIRER